MIIVFIKITLFYYIKCKVHKMPSKSQKDYNYYELMQQIMKFFTLKNFVVRYVAKVLAIYEE